jgi:hypothetical protein
VVPGQDAGLEGSCPRAQDVGGHPGRVALLPQPSGLRPTTANLRRWAAVPAGAF